MSSSLQHARTTLGAMVEAKELPGAQYVVLDPSGPLLELHAGTADAYSARPMTSDTLQMAYSLTKVLTAIAALQLEDQGRWSLDQPLSDFYAEHPYGSSMTLRMLLAHTAGTPNPMPLDWFAVEGEALDRDERLRAVMRAHPKLAAPPGRRYGYSNLGYWLLEKAIEAASGKDYADYLQRHVFETVGVEPEAARFELPPAERLAVGHARRLAPMSLLVRTITPARYWAAPARGFSRTTRLVPHGRAYGGLYTSAAALARVLRDLLQDHPRLLSRRARDAMFTEQHTSSGEATGATLGWVIGELEGVRYLGKQGGGLGFHGNVRVYPAIGLATVLLANRSEISPGPIDARSDALDRVLVRARATEAL